MREEKRMKSCPMCGGAAKIEKYNRAMVYTAIKCTKCYCGTGYEETEEEAIAIWNKRVPDVVRCGECVHNGLKYYDGVGYLKCRMLGHDTKEDSYCSFGKRKEQKDEER